MARNNPSIDPVRIPGPIEKGSVPKGVRSALVAAAAGGLALFAFSGHTTNKVPTLPTVTEFKAHPDAYPGFEQITIEPGDAPQGIAMGRFKNIELGGSAIISEDDRNAA